MTALLCEAIDKLQDRHYENPVVQHGRYIWGNGKEFFISFPYNGWIVKQIRRVGGAKWNKEQGVWHVPAQLAYLESLINFGVDNGFDFTNAKDTIEAVLNQGKDLYQASHAKDVNVVDIHVPNLNVSLLPYQKAGVNYVRDTKRCFIADEPGLGKTYEALAAIEFENAYPALVTCPASVKLNWRKEAKKLIPGINVMLVNGRFDAKTHQKSLDIIEREIVDGSQRTEILLKAFLGVEDVKRTILIINYDILDSWLPLLRLISWGSAVFDESQNLKEHTSKRTKAAVTLAKDIPMRLCLSATPIMNRPKELISQLQILDRLNDLGGFYHYIKRYCGAEKTQFGYYDMKGSSNLRELNDILRSTCFIRRRKKDVLDELPEKIRDFIPVEITTRAEYDRVRKDLYLWLQRRAIEDKDFLASIAHHPKDKQIYLKAQRMDKVSISRRAEAVVKIEALKQLVAKGKVEAAKEWIENFLSSGEKLVVFAEHREVIEELRFHFRQSVAIMGGMTKEQREKAVEKFQNNPDCNLIILNLKAGGVGIDGLQNAASTVLFIEFGWTPAAIEQAEDRIHRMGQSGQVNINFLIGDNTIDDYIWSILNEKQDIFDQSIEGREDEIPAYILEGVLDKITA